ncbi:hypothetical protein [Herbaspirillum huttiense]|uniref:hypothetical protein n=1 Tax=Herbaspirillum huttiense TaxID=863372 RepID=UPI0031D8FC6D
MGCDIHAYKEKLVDGKWVTADEWVPFDYGDEPEDKGIKVPWEQRFTERDYQLFGLLSNGVRTEHEFSFEPRGIPFNASKEVRDEIERWDCDGHSHSYLYLFELKEMRAHLDKEIILISGVMRNEQWAQLKASIDAGSPNYELLFPYSHWCSDEVNYSPFEIDVPAAFYMGAGLDKLISHFDGVDGENQRLVFFFDN